MPPQSTNSQFPLISVKTNLGALCILYFTSAGASHMPPTRLLSSLLPCTGHCSTMKMISVTSMYTNMGCRWYFWKFNFLLNNRRHGCPLVCLLVAWSIIISIKSHKIHFYRPIRALVIIVVNLFSTKSRLDKFAVIAWNSHIHIYSSISSIRSYTSIIQRDILSIKDNFNYLTMFTMFYF